MSRAVKLTGIKLRVSCVTKTNGEPHKQGVLGVPAPLLEAYDEDAEFRVEQKFDGVLVYTPVYGLRGDKR